jgi:hypothetical protein
VDDLRRIVGIATEERDKSKSSGVDSDIIPAMVK